jgi:DNA primase
MTIQVQDVFSVFNSLGITYKDSPYKNIQVICPYHGDRGFGNAVYNKETHNFTCFKCKESGDLVKVYMDFTGKSFIEAKEELGFELRLSLSDNK